MTAHLCTVHDPFHIHRRDLISVLAGQTLQQLAPVTDRPFVMLLNGEPMLRARWDTPTADDDLVAVIMLPQGGDGGSNPLQMVLMMAVMTFAPYAGQFIAGSFGATLATGSMALSMVNAVSVFAGMSLVNALIPPPKPPSSQLANTGAAPSPTYTLQAQGNTARLDSPIPVQYGRMMSFPDFAAQPYLEYQGNEQYLYQLLCLGMGEFDVEQIRIEDTPLSSWEEVEYEVVRPFRTVTLFPTNVVSNNEVSGQELYGSLTGAYARSGTVATITATNHGLSTGRVVYLDFASGGPQDGNYDVVSAADANTFTVAVADSGGTSGAVIAQRYLGPFIANPADTATGTLGFDFIAPRGLYKVNSSTGKLEEMSVQFVVESRLVDDAGDPLNAWSLAGSATITAATSTPQRYSYQFARTSGRHEVRVRRPDAKQTGTEYAHDFAWGGLRAYLPQTEHFGNVTLIALKMRASNNLSMQASRKINVISTRKIPTYNGFSWSGDLPTRSIAWAIIDACHNEDYGAGIRYADIDVAGIHELAQTWEARGDKFDGRFDNKLSFWEALTKICAAGRAKPYMQGNMLRVARDQSATVPVALFSMRNILKGSFSIDYIMPSEDSADSVLVNYFDEVSWIPRRVTSTLAGSTALKPAKIDMFGVVNRDHAHREGLYQAASNRYRRKIIRFSTEMEGFIPSFGDLIAINHDMPAWGQHAEAVAWDGETLELQVNELFEWAATGTHYVGLRTATGAVSGPYAVTPGADDYTLILDQHPDITPYVWHDAERTHVVFGWGETWRQLAKVVSIRPRNLYEVEIECINEDPSVHTADVGVTAPAVVYSQLPTMYTAPVILGLTVRSSPSNPDWMLLSWQPSPGAEYYIIEQSGDEGKTWTRSGDTTANNWSCTAAYGPGTLVRVAAVGLTKGPWVTLAYGSSADYMWSQVHNLMWDPIDTTSMWSY